MIRRPSRSASGSCGSRPTWRANLQGGAITCASARSSRPVSRRSSLSIRSGWPDSNRRFPAPKAGGLARLSHIPDQRPLHPDPGPCSLRSRRWNRAAASISSLARTDVCQMSPIRAAGFEPAISSSPSLRINQAFPRPGRTGPAAGLNPASSQSIATSLLVPTGRPSASRPVPGGRRAVARCSRTCPVFSPRGRRPRAAIRTDRPRGRPRIPAANPHLR